MSNPKGLSRDEIKRIIIDTLAPLGIRRIGIFGSFTRQDNHDKSDIDILVTLPDPKTRKLIGMRWFVIDQELEEILGVPVDVVSEDSLNSHLRAIIRKDLEIIYDKAG